MKKVLRICSYPTKEHESMGLNSYMISGMDSIKTYYLAPFYSRNTFPPPKNTTLFMTHFLTIPSPKNRLKRCLHELKRVFFISLLTLKGIYIIHKYRIDIIHVHSPMYFLVPLYGKIIGKKCFISYHGNEHEKIYNNALLGNLFNSVFSATFSLSHVITNYKKLYPKYSSNFKRINNAVNENIYTNHRYERKKQILAVGRLEKQKGFYHLINGFFTFHKEHPDYQLVIVGEGQLRINIEKQIKKLNLNDSVLLLGKKSRKEIIELYNYSEIFILTSLWEGFPKVLLEAISCGCKIISTNVDSVPNIIGKDYKYLIKPESDLEVSKKLSEIIMDGQKEFSLRYKKILKKYTWNNIIGDMEKIYLEKKGTIT
tara:strand:- start:2390 stop:3499 length:1110 start_codon:yes stop_codon:yes gene_type:complete